MSVHEPVLPRRAGMREVESPAARTARSSTAVPPAPRAGSWEADVNDGRAHMHYFERQFGLNATKLLPGEFYVTADDHVLTTVLGSCVAACILDTEAGIGGMNHFMLPDAGEGVVSGSARYGSYAMELLINDLLKAGARRGALAAKLFGGGNVLQSFTTNQVGTRNVEFVHAYLQAERIPVLAEDVLDVYPRKIFFFPRSGRALVRRLPPAVVAVDLADERAYGSRLRSEPVQGGVELFE